MKCKRIRHEGMTEYQITNVVNGNLYGCRVEILDEKRKDPSERQSAAKLIKAARKMVTKYIQKHPEAA